MPSPTTPVQTPAPLLTDGTVTLRRHTPADADRIVEQSTDESSLRWTTVPRGYTGAHAVEFLEQVTRAWADPGGTRSWAIEITGDDGNPQFAGTIDVRPVRPGTTPHWGSACTLRREGVVPWLAPCASSRPTPSSTGSGVGR